MLAGIAFLLALGAEPQPEPGPKWQLPRLQLALLGESPRLPSVEDWPVEPEKKPERGSQKRESKLNLVAPIVVTSIGAAILGLSALGFAASCSQGGLGGGLLCLAGVVVFGGIGVLSGVMSLIGAVWLIADLVLNSHEISGIEPPKASRDPGQASQPASSGLMVARF